MSEREVIVKLYDARGRLVDGANLGLMAVTGPANDPDSVPHVWAWPGTGGAPRLPAGVYWAEFNAAGARAVRKLTYLN